jgi:phage shock protein C
MEIPQERRLFRSTSNRMIAGVCGGLGVYFNLDATLIRILVVLLAFADGVGILLYVILWVVVPEEGTLSPRDASGRVKDFVDDVSGRTHSAVRGGGARNLIGFALILLGLFALAGQMLPYRWVRWELFWPLLLVIFGFYILGKKK